MVKYVRSVAVTKFNVEDGSECQVTAVYEDGSKVVVDAEYSYYSQDEDEKFVGCVRDGMVCDVTLRTGIAGLSASHMVELSHACIDLYEEGTNITSDEQQRKLTITHKDGDCGFFTTGGNTFDIYEVSDGTNSVLVKYTYDENGDTVTTSNEEACELSGVNGSAHLIACVSMTLLKHFGDNSFYSEAFTDEDGNEIVHDLIVL